METASHELIRLRRERHPRRGGHRRWRAGLQRQRRARRLEPRPRTAANGIPDDCQRAPGAFVGEYFETSTSPGTRSPVSTPASSSTSTIPVRGRRASRSTTSTRDGRASSRPRSAAPTRSVSGTTTAFGSSSTVRSPSTAGAPAAAISTRCSSTGRPASGTTFASTTTRAAAARWSSSSGDSWAIPNSSRCRRGSWPRASTSTATASTTSAACPTATGTSCRISWRSRTAGIATATAGSTPARRTTTATPMASQTAARDSRRVCSGSTTSARAAPGSSPCGAGSRSIR